MYKNTLALNDQQWSVCHKTKPNQTRLLDASARGAQQSRLASKTEILLEPQEAVPPLRKGEVYQQALFFRGMPTGPKAFLNQSGVCG